MHIKDFLTEQWMNDYERKAVVNLTDTSSVSLSVNDLLAFEPSFLDGLMLDYGWITGDPVLRREILSLYADKREETLTMTGGALQGNQMVMDLLLEYGDHVITITPGYQQFSDYPRAKGCSVSEVPLEESDWSLDLEKIKAAIRPETKLVIFANPSNPTGTWLDPDCMEKLVQICKAHDIWLLCDEVYRSYEDDEISVADQYDKGIASASLSKPFGLAGLRLGWLKGNPEIIHRVNVLRDYTIISGGPLGEGAAAVALKHRHEILERTKEVVDSNCAIIQAWLEKSECFHCVLPKKGTVSFMQIPECLSSKQFCEDLLEETGIFFVPGACFDKEGYVRLGLGKKHEDLRGALERLETYTRRYLEEGRGRRQG